MEPIQALRALIDDRQQLELLEHIRFNEIGNMIAVLKGKSQTKWEENVLEIFVSNKADHRNKAHISPSEMRS